MTRTREEEVLERLKEHSIKLTDGEAELIKLSTRVGILERILIVGEGDRKPLVQLLRDMEGRLNELIQSRTTKDAEDKANRLWLRRAVITSMIGFVFAVLVPSVWQIFLFWTKIYPIIEKLKTP